MYSWRIGLLLLLLGWGRMALAWVDGQPATAALGVPDLVSAGAGGPSASNIGSTTDVCVDPTTGKVFVVDPGFNRVLRYASNNAMTTGAAAEGVLGQANFTSQLANRGGVAAANTLSGARKCAFDAAGRLYVSDRANARVLRYDAASSKADGADADGVLGQANFATTATGFTANNLSNTLDGLVVSPGGSLFVADAGNMRVLRYDNAAGKANGAAADGVLGAANTGAQGSAVVSQTTLRADGGLALDVYGNLYVSEMTNRRILRFNQAVSKANGAAADGVLGTTVFNAAGAGAASATTFGQIYAVAVLADGKLYAADTTQNRVLVFKNPAAKANGAAADHVLGQPNFTSTATAVTAAGVNSPRGLGSNSMAGILYISDGVNRRVMVHVNPDLIAVNKLTYGPYLVEVPAGVSYNRDAGPYVFNNPSNISVSNNGVLVLMAPPLAPLQLSGAAPSQVILQIPPGIGVVSIQQPLLNDNLQIRALQQPTQLRLMHVMQHGVRRAVFQVVQGAAEFSAQGVGQILGAVLSADDILFVANAANSSAQFGIDSDGFRRVALTGGEATVSGNTFSAVGVSRMYAGEVAVYDAQGVWAYARLGSYGANLGQTGDPLTPNSGFPFQLTRQVTTPKLDGNSARLGQSPETAFLTALAVAGYRAVGTATAHGVRQMTWNGGTRQWLPLGDIRIDEARSDGVSYNRDGNLEVVSGGLVMTGVPALGDAEALAQQLQLIDPRFSLIHRSDGAYVARLHGVERVGRAGWEVAADSTVAGLSPEAAGSVMFRDGRQAQRIYPAFADLSALRAVLQRLDSAWQAQVNDDATVTLSGNGQRYQLQPAWAVDDAGSVHLGQTYWLDGSVFNLRLDGTRSQRLAVP